MTALKCCSWPCNRSIHSAYTYTAYGVLCGGLILYDRPRAKMASISELFRKVRLLRTRTA